MKRKKIFAVYDGRADAFLRFANCRIRQADDSERRYYIALFGNRLKIDLNIDDQCIDTINRRRLRKKEHKPKINIWNTGIVKFSTGCDKSRNSRKFGQIIR